MSTPLVDRFHDCLDFFQRVLERDDLHDIDLHLQETSQRRTGNQYRFGHALFSMPLLKREVGTRDVPSHWRIHDRFTDKERPLVIMILQELERFGVYER